MCPFPSSVARRTGSADENQEQNLEHCDTRQSKKGHANEGADHAAIELDNPNIMRERQGVEVLKAA